MSDPINTATFGHIPDVPTDISSVSLPMHSGRRRKRALEDPDYEERIQQAIEALRSSVYASINAAARAFNVNSSTLRDRYRGLHQNVFEAISKQRLLSQEAETTLLDWAGHEGASGTPLDRQRLENLASELAGRRVGKNWTRRLRKRHPELVASKAQRLDPKRASNFNKANYDDFADKYEALHAIYGGIPPEHIYNMDEKGIQMGGGRKKGGKHHFFLRKNVDRYRINSDNLELVTIIECVSAAGTSVPPSFILSNGYLPDLRKLPDESISSVATSPSGWTDNELAVRWIEDVFIPFALKNRVSEAPILLIYDGHDSHETAELQRTVYAVEDCDIIIFCFPSKCTHKLQPLDVAVFNHVERIWGAHCSQRLYEGVVMNRYNIIQEYMSIRQNAFTTHIIKSGFEKTGLFPVNRHVFTDMDFAPSRSSSTKPHVPDSYPPDILSSDPPQIPSDVESDSQSDSDSESQGVEVQAAQYQGDNQPPPTIITIDNLITNSEDEEEDADFALLDHEHGHGELNDEEVVETCEGEDAITAGPYTRTSSVHFNLGDLEKIMGLHANVPYLVDQAKPQNVLFSDVRNLRDIISKLCKIVHDQASQIQASNAHCTIMKRQLEAKQTQLYNLKKKKERGSTKVKARFITLPSLKAAFYADEAVRQERETQATQKILQKEVQDASLEARIVKEAATKVFTNTLSSYKTKIDLRILARALHLNDDGTNSALVDRIQKHLSANAATLKQDPRFIGLFGGTRRRGGHQLGCDSGLPSHQPSPNISQPSLVAPSMGPFAHLTAPPLPVPFSPIFQSPYQGPSGHQWNQYLLPPQPNHQT